MSGSPTWYSWFTFPFFAPLSGGVSQDISAGPYQGVPEIEVAVIKEVGSFGQQLGIISEAVRELAEKVGAMPPAKSAHELAKSSEASRELTPIEKLDVLIERVDRVKAAYHESVERDAIRALERLRRVDPGASSKLAARFR
ncbi:hypothetical protein [Methylorubrum extorquens]|uniref:Uncharacterized protein n=1 Tax=Methylorubrum extorquens TaxID=408 RepID=A0AAX3WB76_METEX|nr:MULTISPECIES: hypothetical protein [Methylobacteriaceae]WHQ67675.1 hypothetical protein KEC54_14800 [Methylorubrum extorquens]